MDNFGGVAAVTFKRYGEGGTMRGEPFTAEHAHHIESIDQFDVMFYGRQVARVGDPNPKRTPQRGITFIHPKVHELTPDEMRTVIRATDEAFNGIWLSKPLRKLMERDTTPKVLEVRR